ncbi:endonuclease/exonuclease/phosphatase family protein [uncultured Roseobacter sp.]|uniref:endonuclease/exonuclease/phosphatase family protein n=1 Tax=uncultured Roseobacter sp. TaxID=114847 RepID=UPI002628517F|nr:endonuclease/exonuclease/phosphatase family protein [uncultured Roseobacter sp.]
MRVATYNVEWFNTLFNDDNQLVPDGDWSARYKVTRGAQADALGKVFRAMDADAVMVIEAPDTGGRRNAVAALENFAAHYELRTCEALTGFSNDTRQEIALLYDPQMLQVRHAPRAGTDAVPRFDGVFGIDLDVDATRDNVRFSKPPLELDVVTRAGTAIHMIGAHLKSKAPHGARSDADVMRMAIANRRKQLAQAIWLRARVDQVLDGGVPLVVMGDLNDGPGLDEFEGLFGRSSVEIVLGQDGGLPLFDPHAAQALSQRFGARPTTSRFWIKKEKRYLQALLDYIMVSGSLRDNAPVWRIWHPLDDPECWADPKLREALVTASDHFPVTLDLDI